MAFEQHMTAKILNKTNLSETDKNKQLKNVKDLCLNYNSVW